MSAPMFLLFDGFSEDGRGEPKYVGRTSDSHIARNHYERCNRNPYSTGKVVIVTDDKFIQANGNTDWYLP